ncbi:unnamed protein product [Symbiodinium necroappetens]|uniref:Uncharacterized protein n=1 Tax=Symbiodinium necroappetens TaxID=1628268 RepID=A0A812XBA3_9DINO|nr:unnamed protein product [Symbiodinium necroappetens]
MATTCVAVNGSPRGPSPFRLRCPASLSSSRSRSRAWLGWRGLWTRRTRKSTFLWLWPWSRHTW